MTDMLAVTYCLPSMTTEAERKKVVEKCKNKHGRKTNYEEREREI